jgi:hypothetical protein
VSITAAIVLAVGIICGTILALFVLMLIADAKGLKNKK